MRKILAISAAIVGVLILVVVGLAVYAALNLNSIIKTNRAYLLAKVSDSLGRRVDAQAIDVSLGWGIGLGIKSVQIADDPRFSQTPFVQANEVSGEVAFLPLLRREVEVTRLVFKQPTVRVLRNAAGELNLSTMGKKEQPQAPAAPSAPSAPKGAAPSGQGPMVAGPATGVTGAGGLQSLAIARFSIEGGQLLYQDATQAGAPVRISNVDLDVEDFSASAPFKIGLKLALLGDEQNLKVDGRLGPLLRDGAIDAKRMPFALKISLGPLTLDRLRTLAPLRGKIPAKLSMPDPVSLQAKVEGTADSVNFDLSTDLSSGRIVYLGVFNKPAGVPFRLKAAGVRRNGTVSVSEANLTLSDMEAKASNIVLGAGGFRARLDSNRFSLDALTKTVAAMAKYDASGKAEVHADVRAAEGKTAEINGTVALAGVSIKPAGAKIPGVTDINSNIQLAGNSAVIESTSFTTGGVHGSLAVRAESLQPLRATYTLKADDIKLAQFVPSRPPDEELRQLSVNGTASQSSGALDVTAQVISSAGLVADVPYQNLALSAEYGHERLNLRSLNLNAYGGSIAATADATLGAQPAFNATLNTNNIDLQQALTAQKAKMADIVRGQLTGQVEVSGRGTKFDEIKPTLQGSGQMAIKNGKLIGVNLGAEAVGKVEGIPGIGTLVSPTVIARHPALFKDRDTDLKTASLSFVLQGPRITTHDLTVASVDYTLLGDGWVDMDKNIDLTAHVLMSKEFSKDLQAEKKNVVYLEDKQGQIDIPVIIRGALPKPAILPDVQTLAQRAASHAIEKKGQELLGKLLGKKGGASQPQPPSGTGAPSPAGPKPAAPANPLEQLRKLF